MSDGRFVEVNYELDDGEVGLIRVQPETRDCLINSVANTPSADPVTLRTRVYVQRGRREYGIRARFVTCRWVTAPDGYDDRTLFSIPVFAKTLFDGLAPGQSVAYNGGTGTIVSLEPERIR